MDLLVITSKPPYSTSSAIDALEAALAATNIGLEVGFLFRNEAVYQLVNDQAPDGIYHKSTLKRLSLLPLFDIESIFVCKKSAIEYDIKLDHLDFDFEMVNFNQIQDIITKSKSVLSF